MTNMDDQVIANVQRRVSNNLAWATPQSEIRQTPLSPEEVHMLLKGAHMLPALARANAEHEAEADRYPLMGLLILVVGAVFGAALAVWVLA